MKYEQICAGVYQIGGPGFSTSSDCCMYLLDGGGKRAIIDCGTGSATKNVLASIAKLAPDPGSIKYIVLTHGHIDHIGGISGLMKAFPEAETIAHRLELPAIEGGDMRLTAADWYGVKYSGIKVDIVINDPPYEALEIGEMKLHFIHTPGHTPGSLSLLLDWDGSRILFGQDIHGPFNQHWGSNMQDWRHSMQMLLDTKADILCEGHFGVIKPSTAVYRFIDGYMRNFAYHG